MYPGVTINVRWSLRKVCITGTSQVVAFILREKMPQSQRGITLWEHSKPVDLENNTVLIHVSITSLNINHSQTFQRSAIASWQKLILWDQRVQKLSYAALCATIMADMLGFTEDNCGALTVDAMDCIWQSCLHWTFWERTGMSIALTAVFVESWSILLKWRDPA